MDTAILEPNEVEIASAPEPAVHSGRGVKIMRACTINRPADVIYQFWRRFENLPLVMTNLISVTQTTPTQSHWVARGTKNKPVEWDAVIINEHPNELIAWKTSEESDVRHAGSVRFQPAPAGQGTEVLVTLEYDLAHTKVKAFAKFFGKKPADTVSQDLHRLKALLETGEIPTIAGQSRGAGKTTTEENQ